tara:strand:- start:640 stop:885 length:246 start_codon:yes stop_codon:yes gene_type:complete
MTRKDYKAIVEALALHHCSNQLLTDLCKVFYADNNRFDASKFIYTYNNLRLDAGYLSDGTPVCTNDDDMEYQFRSPDLFKM